MREYITLLDGAGDKAVVLGPPETGKAEVDGRVMQLDLAATEFGSVPGSWRRVSVVVDGVVVNVIARRAGSGEWDLFFQGGTHRVSARSRREQELETLQGPTHASRGGNAVVAPMPGVVVSVLKGPGDSVEAGDPVVVISAMKMENELRADRTGTVEDVLAAPGEAVTKGQTLITLAEPSAGEE